MKAGVSASADLPGAIRAHLPRWLAAPYLDGGRDLAGWDCWGCVAFVGREAFGQAHDQFAGAVQTIHDDAAVVGAIGARLSLYRKAPREAGAVALLRQCDQPLHVGILLSPRHLLHAMQHVGTRMTDLRAEPKWEKRVIETYLLA